MRATATRRMRLGPGRLAGGAVVLAIVGALAARTSGSPPAIAGAVGAEGALAGYVGSAACLPCHAKEFKEWKDSLHSKMEQQASAASVKGLWSPEGTVVRAEAEGKRIAMFREGEAYWVEAPDANGLPARYPVERTVGNRHKQRYLTKFPDGSWHALPVLWLEKDGKFVEWKHQASAKPGSGGFWADGAWQWQTKCAGCHVTGLDLGIEPDTGSYGTRWTELAIGCEACHGPGEAHVKAGGGTANVLSASRMSHDRQVDACGKCHSRGTAGPEEGAPTGLTGRLAYPWNMTPGTALSSVYVQGTPEKDPADFWGDGSSKNHHQQWTSYVRSGMFLHGKEWSPTCTTCHEPHRAAELKASVEDNRLCLSCHREFRTSEGLASHTGHGGDPAANPGARCVECHMPRVVEHAGTDRLRAHEFALPNPARARETGTPDACLLCHTGKDAAWSEASFERIWPRAGGR